jgi:hypothetical protein
VPPHALADLARPTTRTLPAILAILLLTRASGAAQELEPRAYSPSPVGTTFLVVSATRSAGGVFTDPAAPLVDATATIGVLGVAIGHVFNLAGKSAMVLGVIPITWGQARGQIGEDRREASRRGLADPRVKLSMILAGSRPMTPVEFASTPRRAIVGVSLTVVPPVGQYDSTRLINLGSHRWSFKPETGFSLPLGRWTVDTYAGVWFFTDNAAYYPGFARRRQHPIFAGQAHVSYTLARRAWLAGNATWYGGGQSFVDGVAGAAPYRNTRLGVTLALPVGGRQSLKIAYSTGATTRVGADFRTISAAWQFLIL